MLFRRRTVAIGAMIVAIGSLVAGAVARVTRSSDETALQPTRHGADKGIERKVDDLLRKMTLDEKLQQLQLLSDGQITDADARAGVGSVFSLTDPAKINHFQHIAVEQSRLHIPILFAYDTIHGYRTIFPIPLGRREQLRPVRGHRRRHRSPPARRRPSASSRSTARWSTSRTSRAGAGSPRAPARTRTSARCSPPRGSRPPRAPTTPRPTRWSTSVKHFAAYGQPEGGREYNTTDMSEQRLRNLYLPPFKAAIDAGADTVMCSFNAINGVPGCANHEIETDILKREWGFDGFIESDYTAVAELRACPPKNPDDGPVRPRRRRRRARRGAAALNAGTDSEMVSTNIRDFGAAAARAAPDLDGADRRRGARGSCGSSSAPGSSTTPTSTRPRPSTRPAS